ncbi:MAG TPA: response regulator [Trichocoleus sp.]|jgi:CheY-like chemotaxis protein
MASQKVLIVDDSKVIRMQVKDMLPKGNFEVLEAGDGVEGLEILHQEPPSLLLIDFFMPRLNGWEVVRELQTSPKLQSIPVVMMSGRREEVEQTVPELFEYFEFISKPFEQPLLLKAIRSAMTKAKGRQPTPQSPASHAAPATTTPTAKPASPTQLHQPAEQNGEHLIHALTAEVKLLQEENAKLKAEFDAMKRQVTQIMTFIRQRMK